jgi:hypothetical protein
MAVRFRMPSLRGPPQFVFRVSFLLTPGHFAGSEEDVLLSSLLPRNFVLFILLYKGTANYEILDSQ